MADASAPGPSNATAGTSQLTNSTASTSESTQQVSTASNTTADAAPPTKKRNAKKLGTVEAVRKSSRNADKAQTSYIGTQASASSAASKRKAAPTSDDGADAKRVKPADSSLKDIPSVPAKRSKKSVRAISLAHSPDPAYVGFPMTSFIGKISGSLGTIEYGNIPASLNRFKIDDPLIDGETPNDIPLPWKSKVHIKVDVWEAKQFGRLPTPSLHRPSDHSSMNRVSKLLEFRTNTKSKDWKRLLKIMRLAFMAEKIARERDPLYDAFVWNMDSKIPENRGLVLVSPDFHLLPRDVIRILYGRHCLLHLSSSEHSTSHLPSQYGNKLSGEVFNREVTSPVQIHSQYFDALGIPP